MANRYATTWRSSDGIVPTVPSHYPPLFPWLVGHTAALLHTPAWQLLGSAETIAMSAAVVAGFALWRRLVPGPVALALSLMVPLCFALPQKGYEVLALAVFTPWVLATFGRPPRGRLHWLLAGVIVGLCVAWYWAYIAYGALGIAGLAVMTWRASPDRGRYLRHIGLTLAVTAVVSSWYLVPYTGWALMHGAQQMDMFEGGGISDSPLPFLAATPLAALEAGRPGRDGVVPEPHLVGGAHAAADRQRLRLPAVLPHCLHPHRAHRLHAGHPAPDRAAAGDGRGADRGAGGPGPDPPGSPPPRPCPPACPHSACAWSSRGPP